MSGEPMQDLRATDGFTVAKVEGGWQVYDVRYRRHIGRVWCTQRKAQEHIDRAERGNRPEIARFILTGKTK